MSVLTSSRIVLGVPRECPGRELAGLRDGAVVDQVANSRHNSGRPWRFLEAPVNLYRFYHLQYLGVSDTHLDVLNALDVVISCYRATVLSCHRTTMMP